LGGIYLLDDIKRAIDYLDIDGLWKLACRDPGGFYNKFTIRYVNRSRMEKIYAFLQGRDRDKLGQQRHFEYLLLCKIEHELGSGMFRR
jgi:hypothetical protein